MRAGQRAASTIQTGPRAKVIGWPDAVRNVVPSSAVGRDQRAWKTSPPRSTSARPEPTLFANGVGACGPVAGGIVTWVYWMTTVAAESCPSSAAGHEGYVVGLPGGLELLGNIT